MSDHQARLRNRHTRPGAAVSWSRADCTDVGVSRARRRGAFICGLALLVAAGANAKTVRPRVPPAPRAPEPWPLVDTAADQTVARVALHRRLESVAKSRQTTTRYFVAELREDLQQVVQAVDPAGEYRIDVLNGVKPGAGRPLPPSVLFSRSDVAYVLVSVTGPSADVRREIIRETEARYRTRPARVDCTVKAAPYDSPKWAACFPEEAAALARARESEEVRLARAAEGGDVQAQFALGELYANGWGVTPRDATAARWWRMAAECGVALAQLRLGRLYLTGGGVPEDYAEAKQWIEKAAEQGLPAAQNTLGVMYAKGIGVLADPARAAAWYLKAAEQGDVAAQVNLGRALFLGRGVTRDRAEAVRWYLNAADAGNGLAQLAVAGALRETDSGLLDYVNAHKWLNIAVASAARRPAPDAIGVYEDAGAWPVRAVARGVRETVEHVLTVAQLAEAQLRAREWMAARPSDDSPDTLRQSAEAGDADAQFELGMRYARGDDVLQDFVEALQWMSVAASRGSRRDEASTEIMRRARKALAARMTPEAIAEAQRRAREWVEAFETHEDARER